MDCAYQLLQDVALEQMKRQGVGICLQQSIKAAYLMTRICIQMKMITLLLKQIMQMAIAARKTKTVPCRMGMEQTERTLRRRTRAIPRLMVQMRK